MSVKIRISILVVLLLSVGGATAVSASSTLPTPDMGIINPQSCRGCDSGYSNWYCVTPLTRVNPNSDVGDLNWYDHCVWTHYADCIYNTCTCMDIGLWDYCTYGWE